MLLGLSHFFYATQLLYFFRCSTWFRTTRGKGTPITLVEGYSAIKHPLARYGTLTFSTMHLIHLFWQLFICIYLTYVVILFYLIMVLKLQHHHLKQIKNFCIQNVVLNQSNYITVKGNNPLNYRYFSCILWFMNLG